MVAEFGVIPIGAGTSVSRYLVKVADLVAKSGLDYRVGSMGTVVEGSWEQVFGLIKRCHQVVLKDVDRVWLHVSVDDRKDHKGKGRIDKKVRSIEEKLGRRLRK